ncbi:MAG: TRM11 family SAM-dependent methyltransferase [Planctomycetota bacterium]
MQPKPRPRLQTTTLWYYPSQQYGDAPLGTPAFQGATPAYLLWNLISRYTRENDLVVDPFCGGGTTIDVARSLGRRALGYDVAPIRDDIFRADARALPLEASKVDFVFMDPPYSTHLKYSGGDDCIGELDAFGSEYFDAMDLAFAEADRVLKDRRYLAVYCSDSFKKKRGFVPIGTTFAEMLGRRFRAIDHVAVVRGNRKLEQPAHHRVAAEDNFFLRGFNHLLIFKKEQTKPHVANGAADARAGAGARSPRASRSKKRGSPDPGRG